MTMRGSARGCFEANLAQDLRAMGTPKGSPIVVSLRSSVGRFVLLLRLAEGLKACRGRRSPIYLLARALYGAYSTHLGMSVPLGVFGAGLSVAHVGTLVVNGKARVGENCRIHPGVTIGAIAGGAPRIGSDVFIGPNAVILGDIVVGRGATIGALSLVDRDVPEGGVVVSARAVVIRRDGVPWTRWDDSPYSPGDQEQVIDA